MAGRKLCLTWMPTEEGAPAPDAAVAALDQAGFDVFGARWKDDVLKHAWAELADALADPASAEVWVVAARRQDLEVETNRWGLSMATAVVRSKRGATPPHFVLVGLDFAPKAEDLPVPLRGHVLIDGGRPWAARLTLAVRGKPSTARPEGFHLDAIGHPHIGLWLVAAPPAGDWRGAMLGVSDGAKVQQHGVGKRAELPSDTVLEFPIDEIQAEVGGTEFLACACKNQIGPDAAYWVQVQGRPRKLLVGGYPDEEDADAWVVTLS